MCVKFSQTNKNNKQRKAAARTQLKQRVQPKQLFRTGQAPISKSIRFTPKSPSLTSRGATILVSHTEYIGDVASQGSAYVPSRYPINPGLNVTFPWLSSIAANYESYKFKKLQFMYKPICATTTAGKAILAVDYDASDAAPATKIAINSYQSTVSCSVWDSCTHTSTTQNLLKFGVQRYVRTGGLPPNTDVKTYDIGNFYLATANTPTGAATLGELYVQYEVELLTPQLPSSFSTTGDTSGAAPTGIPIEQLTKIVVNAQGFASLAATFVNQPLAVLAKQAIDSGKTVVDLVLNPQILGTNPLMLLMRGPAGTQFGAPPKAAGSLGNAITLQQEVTGTEFQLNIFQNAVDYAQALFTEIDLYVGQKLSTNNLPTLRYLLPFASTLYLNIIGVKGKQGYSSYQIGTYAPSIQGPTYADTIINWQRLADIGPKFTQVVGVKTDWMNTGNELPVFGKDQNGIAIETEQHSAQKKQAPIYDELSLRRMTL